MAAQISGDEKSGTAAQTPSLIDLEISRERELRPILTGIDPRKKA
jgi:hypothetical protein